LFAHPPCDQTRVGCRHRAHQAHRLQGRQAQGGQVLHGALGREHACGTRLREGGALVKITEHLAKLRKDYSDSTAEVARLEKLAALYPDLRRYEGRWKKFAFCSASVNDKVTDYETRFNCSCCPDSPLEFWPYLETEHGRVYSDPPDFFIGEKSY